MERSESIKNLIVALCAAQKQITAAKKSSINPHFKSKYADLSEVIDAIKEPLAANGLAYAQLTECDNDNHYLTTILMHTSGEFISAKARLVLHKNDMQGLGSAVSYMRRYSLSAIIGLSQEDTDGNDACDLTKKDDNHKKTTQKKPLDKLTDAQIDSLEKLSSGMDDIIEIIKKKLKLTAIREVPAESYDAVMMYLRDIRSSRGL